MTTGTNQRVGDNRDPDITNDDVVGVAPKCYLNLVTGETFLGFVRTNESGQAVGWIATQGVAPASIADAVECKTLGDTQISYGLKSVGGAPVVAPKAYRSIQVANKTSAELILVTTGVGTFYVDDTAWISVNYDPAQYNDITSLNISFTAEVGTINAGEYIIVNLVGVA